MDTSTNNQLLSSKDAGAILGYTHDYISRLCRQGKMSGIQKGREWFVTQEEIDAFKLRHQEELAEKKKELSKKFSKIRREAEARKREARKAAELEATISTKATAPEEVFETHQSTLKFSIPKQVVALAILGLVVLGQAILNSSDVSSSVVTKSVANTSSVSEKITYADIQESLDGAIKETIYAQAEFVEPVVYAVNQNIRISDFFKSIISLPQDIYNSLIAMGNGYLTLYLLQGEALYESMNNLNTMGALVLRGYELIGESFWFGSKDILEMYSKIFNVEKAVETSFKYPRAYVASVTGGFEYLKQEMDGSILDRVQLLIKAVSYSAKDNVYSNVASVHETVSSISHTAISYIGNIFEFDLVEKERRIRAIKLNE